MFSEMSAGMNELKEEVRDLKDQHHSYITRLESRNSQLCDEKSQWLLQQRSSGATRLLGRSTASLPSFITPVKSSSPIVDVSREDLDEPLTPPKKWTRGGDLRSTEQCKKPVRLWWVTLVIFKLFFLVIAFVDLSFPSSPFLVRWYGFVKILTTDIYFRWRWFNWSYEWW